MRKKHEEEWHRVLKGAQHSTPPRSKWPWTTALDYVLVIPVLVAAMCGLCVCLILDLFGREEWADRICDWFEEMFYN